jgi:hypothetical protein
VPADHHHGGTEEVEPVVAPEVDPLPGRGDPVAVIAATLLPGPVLRLPVLCALAPPCIPLFIPLQPSRRRGGSPRRWRSTSARGPGGCAWLLVGMSGLRRRGLPAPRLGPARRLGLGLATRVGLPAPGLGTGLALLCDRGGSETDQQEEGEDSAEDVHRNSLHDRTTPPRAERQGCVADLIVVVPGDERRDTRLGGAAAVGDAVVIRPGT